MRAEEHATRGPSIDASRGVTCGIVSMPDLALDRRRGHERVHPRARHRVVVDVDEADLAGVLRACAATLEHRLERCRPCGGSSSTETTHSPLAERRAASARLLALGSPSASGELALARRRAARAARGPRRPRARIAAICAGVVPQQPPMIRAPSSTRLRGELGEVVGRRVRDRRRGRRRGSRGRRSGAPRAAGRASPHAARARAAPPAGPTPWFAPIAATSSAASALGAASAAATPPERLGVLVEGQQRDDRQRRDARAPPRSAATSSSRSKNVSTMKRSTPRPSRSCACSAKTRPCSPASNPRARRAGRSSRR